MVTCRIADVLGRTESCPAERCAFWEPDTAERCAFRNVDLTENRPVADWLLEMRETLESYRATETRHRFHALLNESCE